MPTQHESTDGKRPTGKKRIRAGLFGIAIIEELIETRDGTSYWKRCDRFDDPVQIGKATNP